MTSPAIEINDLRVITTKQGKPTKYEEYQNTLRIKLQTPESISNILSDLASGRLTNYCTAYSQMLDTDLDMAAIISSRVERAISNKWEVKPATNDPDDLIAARFCEEVLQGIPNLNQSFLSIADAIPLGYSTHEFDWKYDEGCMIVGDIMWTHPRRFIYDTRNGWELKLYDYGLKGMYGEKLMPDKWLVHHSQERQGDPCMYGLVRSLLPWWLYRQWLNKFWLHYNEVFALPHIFASVDENTPEETINQLQDALEHLSYDHVAVLKGETEIKIEQTANRQSVDSFGIYMDKTRDAITRYVLGSSDINAPSSTGSLGAVAQRTDAVVDPKRDRDSYGLASTIRLQLFRALINKNRHLFAKPPKEPLFEFIYPEGASSSTAAGQPGAAAPQYQQPIQSADLVYSKKARRVAV